MVENFFNLMRKKVTQIQKTQRVPSKRNSKRPTPRQIIIKMAKFKDKKRILKAPKEKQKVAYKETSMKLVADFSMETPQVTRDCKEIRIMLSEISQAVRDKYHMISPLTGT